MRPGLTENCANPKYVKSEILNIEGSIIKTELKLPNIDKTEKINEKTTPKNSTKAKAIECEICKKVFANKYQLKSHTLLHLESKKFECLICGKTFLQQFVLKVHEQTHNGFKHLECETCGRSFKNSVSMINHKRIHLAESEHECDVCYKLFKSQTRL